eukprot:gb/GEZJ01001001.1/.p1 GENE.gb/GEZJ01001001.1/~~gb/GEZJ01001001.1/.p1  ORF type:complete len:849 (-),score=107.19 gb/GEZJ01001001.1/:2961-5507(-)
MYGSSDVQMGIVKVEVSRARNLRSSLFHTPSAVVELHTIPGFPAVAASEPIPGDANPVWDFTYEYEVNHYPPHRLSFIVVDATRPKATPLGRVLLDVIHPVTSGWFSLSEDENNSSELFVTVTCKNVCDGRASLSRVMKHEASIFEIGNSTQLELRQVAASPGFLFRSGELSVKIEAVGVPQSVRKPFLKLAIRDQFLKVDETPESSAAWEKILEELAQADEQIENVDSARKEKTGDESEATSTTHEDKQNKSEDNNRVWDGGDADCRAFDVKGESSKERKHIELTTEAKAHEESASFDHELDASDHLQTRWSKILSFGIESRKLLQSGRGARLKRPKPFTRTKPFTEARKEGFVAHSHSPLESELETGVVVRQNSEPGPQSYKTKWRLSGLNSSVRNDSTKFSEHQRSAQSFASMTFSGVSKRRRGVRFGAVKFALFEGEDPVKLKVQLVDRSSKLPGLMSVFTDQAIDLKEIKDLLCSCSDDCKRHVLQYQMSDRGPVNRKIILRVLIHLRTWKPKAASNNITHHFLNTLRRVDEMSLHFKETFPEAEKLTYLLVGGLFTDHYPTYFEKNIQYLQETLCLPRVQSIPIHTEGSVKRNAKIIKDSVLKTCRGAKSVVLIGHSKGGIDATAVLQVHPEVIPFIFGIITFQAPFGGTFLVDFVAQSKIVMSTIKGIIEGLWKGDKQAMQDMCYSSRLKALGFFSNPIENTSHAAQDAGVGETLVSRVVDEISQPVSTPDIDVFRRIPIVSFGSFASFDLLSIRSAATAAGIASMSPAAKAILDHTGFLCDGLVILNDARIPFSDFVSLNDMMHTEPALYVPGTNYPPGKLTASALVMLFHKTRRAQGGK